LLQCGLNASSHSLWILKSFFFAIVSIAGQSVGCNNDSVSFRHGGGQQTLRAILAHRPAYRRPHRTTSALSTFQKDMRRQEPNLDKVQFDIPRTMALMNMSSINV